MVDRIVRVAVVLVNVFLGLTAVFGAIAVVPTLPLAVLAGSPFPDYTIPSLALAMVGVGALVAAALMVFNMPLGVQLSIAVGAGIAIFEIVETLVVGLDVWLHALGLRPEPAPLFASADPVAALFGIPIPLWLQPFYFTLGAVIVALTLRLYATHAVAPDRQVLRERSAA